MSKPVFKADKFTDFRCPECGGTLRLERDNVPDHALCPHCAAISVFEPSKRFYRMLRTEEWVNIVMLPSGYDLIEARV